VYEVFFFSVNANTRITTCLDFASWSHINAGMSTYYQLAQSQLSTKKRGRGVARHIAMSVVAHDDAPSAVNRNAVGPTETGSSHIPKGYANCPFLRTWLGTKGSNVAAVAPSQNLMQSPATVKRDTWMLESPCA
jgi:hypothetical protein